MQISKHGSFYIRNGWPTKIMDALREPHIFSPNNELYAVDTIGVGRVMIKAMRYWATVLGIASEGKDQQGIYHTLTPLANVIAQNDLYCSDRGTLWLLHRNVARSFDEATAWAWAFNIYHRSSFTKEEFTDAFYVYLQREGASYVRKAVEKEFDCFKNTYVSEQKFSVSQVIEENMVPFFAPLKLIEYSGNGRFERHKTSSREIPARIFLICVLLDNSEYLQSNRQISLDQLMEEPGQVGKYMNLSSSALIEILQRLDNDQMLKLVNNFGSRYIELDSMDVSNMLNIYYQMIGR